MYAIREQGKFVTSVYQKPFFSGAYTHFYSFLRCLQNRYNLHIDTFTSTIDTFKRDISEKWLSIWQKSSIKNGRKLH